MVRSSEHTPLWVWTGLASAIAFITISVYLLWDVNLKQTELGKRVVVVSLLTKSEEAIDMLNESTLPKRGSPSLGSFGQWQANYSRAVDAVRAVMNDESGYAGPVGMEIKKLLDAANDSLPAATSYLESGDTHGLIQIQYGLFRAGELIKETIQSNRYQLHQISLRLSKLWTILNIIVIASSLLALAHIIVIIRSRRQEQRFKQML